MYYLLEGIMPLSKQRNRDRMREIRLHKAKSPPYQIKAVQPKHIDKVDDSPSVEYIDADGNPVYE